MRATVDSARLSEVIRNNIEHLCREFFPLGTKECNEWKIANTAGTEGHSLGICLASEKAGLWHDHSTGEGGNFVELLKLSRGLRFPDAVELIERCLGVNLRVNGNSQIGDFDWLSLERLSPGYQDRLAEWRGFAPESAKRFVDKDWVRLLDKSGVKHWAFPVVVSGKVKGCHYRAVNVADGVKVDWGYSPTVKQGGPGLQPFILGDEKAPVSAYLVESTWDGLSLCDKLGVDLVDAVCVFCTRGGENYKLARQLPVSVKEIYVWPQNDEAGQDWLTGLRRTLQTPLRVVPTPREHKDVNDWIKAGATTDNLLAVMKGAPVLEPLPADIASGQSGNQSEPTNASQMPEWIKRKRTSELTTIQPAQVLRGVLYRACKLILMAGSKSFKTWALMDLAFCVANGLPWWSAHTEKCPVVYLDFELLDYDFRWRLEQIRKAYGKGDINAVERIGLKAKTLQAEHWEWIHQQIIEAKAGLMLCDPTYKMLGPFRDENSASDIAQVTAIFDRVTEATGAAAAYAQHYSKGNQAGKESLDRGAGSGVWTRDADAIITMTKHSQGDDHLSVEYTLRSFPRIDPFVVRWEVPLFVRMPGLDPADLKQQGGGRKKKWTADQLIECLGSKDLSTGEFQAYVHKETGMPQTNFYELLAEAKKQGLLHKCATDDKWEVVQRKSK